MELPKHKIPAKTEEEAKAENPFSTHEHFITKEQVSEFENLLNQNSGETEVDTFLTNNDSIFTAMLHEYRTGHHGAIVIPKQAIQPRIQEKGIKGLIPDFIVGGDSSNGWSWWIVEIKSPSQTIFSQNGNGETYFSSEVNKGLCQLLEYIDFCSEHQAMLRDLFKLKDFREPKGLLLAGRESELKENEPKKKLKAAWNRVAMGRLEIRTFDFVRRHLTNMYNHHNKQL